MSNPNRDPKSGEYSEGPGGGSGGADHLKDVARQTGLKTGEFTTGSNRLDSLLNDIRTGGAHDPNAQSIRQAFNKLTDNGMDAARMSQLRNEVAHIPPDNFNKTLLAMKKSGEANLMHLDNPRDIEKERSAAIHEGRNAFHTVFLTKKK